MRRRVIVYPYDLQFAPFLRYPGLLPGMEIAGVVAPTGWGLAGIDAGEVDGGSALGMVVGTDFERALESGDTALFVRAEAEVDFRSLILPRMAEAVRRGMGIVSTLSLLPDEEKVVQEICRDGGVEFQSFSSAPDRICEQVMGEKAPLKELDATVVLVLGVAERTWKFDLQLALRQHFLRRGFKVSQVGTREYCELLGFHSFPRFMFEKGVSETEKVVSFNYFLKELEVREAPEVMIVGVPGGVMPFNGQFNNRFGVLAYEVSQAVAPDAVVCGVLYEDYKPSYFPALVTSLKYKLGFEVDCFNLAPVQFNWGKSEEEMEMVYNTLDYRFIDEKKRSYAMLETPVFNVGSPGDGERMGDYLTRKLEGYAGRVR